MSDEQPKNVQSVPPPATDEIDQDWGGTPAPPGATAKSGSEEAKPVKAAASKPSPAASKSKAKDDEDDEEDEDDDEDEDDEEDEDDDEDDEDESDEDEDDDEDESGDKEAPDNSAQRAPHSAAKRAATDSSDWLPDWAPWAVLGGLVTLGLAGGLGAISSPNPERATREPEGSPAPATPTPAPKPTVTAAAAMPQAAAVGAEESVEASHLLVAYQGAMRAAPTTTRTKEEAKKRAEEALAKSKKGTAFDKLVAEYSDEPGAAARGGKLGSFTRNRMVKPFADAAFLLKPGQISGVVETAFGYHVIQRTK